MQIVIGIALVIAGLVLAIGFGDTEFFWFRGQPLGIVLAILGALDIAEALWPRRKGPA